MANKADWATPMKNPPGNPSQMEGDGVSGGKPFDSGFFEAPSGGIIPFTDLETIKGVD